VTSSLHAHQLPAFFGENERILQLN
jgi:hypothetical protein